MPDLSKATNSANQADTLRAAIAEATTDIRAEWEQHERAVHVLGEFERELEDRVRRLPDSERQPSDDFAVAVPWFVKAVGLGAALEDLRNVVIETVDRMDQGATLNDVHDDLRIEMNERRLGLTSDQAADMGVQTTEAWLSGLISDRSGGVEERHGLSVDSIASLSFARLEGRTMPILVTALTQDPAFVKFSSVAKHLNNKTYISDTSALGDLANLAREMAVRIDELATETQGATAAYASALNGELGRRADMARSAWKQVLPTIDESGLDSAIAYYQTVGAPGWKGAIGQELDDLTAQLDAITTPAATVSVAP